MAAGSKLKFILSYTVNSRPACVTTENSVRKPNGKEERRKGGRRGEEGWKEEWEGEKKEGRTEKGREKKRDDFLYSKSYISYVLLKHHF